MKVSQRMQNKTFPANDPVTVR